MHVLTVIPARVGSSRLPEKPLSLLAGEPLIRVVARRVLSLGGVAELVVATDDRRVLEAVAPIGVTGILTDGAHCSGTDRAGEVLRRPEYAHIDIVLNVQGDQPFIPGRAASGALEMVRTGFPIGTAAARLTRDCLENGSKVKVWVDRGGRAQQFSRR